MEQTDLFEELPERAAKARKNDPATSKTTANRMEGVAQNQLELIYDTLVQLGGPATYREIATAAGIDRHDVGRRLSVLRRRGWIRAVGVRESEGGGGPMATYEALERDE